MEQIVLSPSLFDLAQGDPEVLETGILRRAEGERRVEGPVLSETRIRRRAEGERVEGLAGVWW